MLELTLFLPLFGTKDFPAACVSGNSGGEGEGRAKRCLTCVPVFFSPGVVVFMGKALLHGQLQSLAEVSAGGLCSLERRGGLSVKVQTIIYVITGKTHNHLRPAEYAQAIEQKE